MTGVEIVPATPAPISRDEWMLIQERAAILARSNHLPAAYRGKPNDIIAAALYGRELGLSDVVSLNKIHVIDGRPSLSAELQLAVIRRAGHDVRAAAVSDESVTLRCHRRDWPAEEWESVTFTMAQARLAGLAAKDPWKKYPSRMLRWRCVSELASLYFSDVLLGLTYSPDDLGVDIDPTTGDAIAVHNVISDETAEALRAEIMALPAEAKARVVAALKVRGLVLGRFDSDGRCEVAILDARDYNEVAAIIAAEAEQFAPADSPDDAPARPRTPPSETEAAAPPVGHGRIWESPPVSGGGPPQAVEEIEIGAGSREAPPAPASIDTTKSCCRTKGCGHSLAVHDPHCTGVHVRGIPNSDDAYNEPCRCLAFSGPAHTNPQAAIDVLSPPIDVDDFKATRAAKEAEEALAPSTSEDRQAIAMDAKRLGMDDDQRHAFVHLVTKGRASGASQCTHGDARRVIRCLALIAAHSLELDWFESDDPDAIGGWEPRITWKNNTGRDWYMARP